MEIEKMLVLSTSHITNETYEWLMAEIESSDTLIVYDKPEYGWFILIPDWLESDQELNANIPDELYKLLELAKKHECRWLELDCGGPEEEELPTFEW